MHYRIHKFLHPLLFQRDTSSLIKKLRIRIQSLPPLPNINASTDNAEIAWVNFRKNLRNEILHSDPRYFLHWPVIAHTMFYTGNRAELHVLQQSRRWNEWKDAIQETSCGYPSHHITYPLSSGNLIHHAFFLERLIENNAIDIKNIKTIFEFGGGYGSTARLFYNFGFNGQYVIFDLPEFLLLQEFFLYFAIPYNFPNVSFISEINSTEELSPDLFIASWSLSESPLTVREDILSHTREPKHIAIAYQNTFREIDNIAYFKELSEHLSNYSWIHETVEHQPGNSFLFGKLIQ